MSDELLLHTEGDVLVLTLNRPHRRNAISMALARAMADAMAQYAQRDDWRVAIITGADNTFCSGMDLKGFSQGESPFVPGAGFAGLTQKPPTKPLIAAVEGFAVAGGCEIALSCDLIVASDTAQFGLPEVQRGLIASAGGLMRLPRRLPYHLAMEMALTGDPIGAPLAFQHGLVNRLVPPGQALPTALALAKRIAQNAPLSLLASKQIIEQSATWPIERMFELQQPYANQIAASQDAQEGALAFVEKRPARWSGR